jgi:hypothetical protein
MEVAPIIAKTQANSLARISKQIAIVNTLLALSNQDRVIEFLLENELFSLRLLSVHFPLDEQLLSNYADDLDWSSSGISGNPNIIWTKDLIQKMSKRLDWSTFSVKNQTPNELLTFEQVDWECLSANSKIGWDLSFIAQNMAKINFKSLSHNVGVQWSFNFLEEYKDKWDWQNLSQNPQLPWSEELIERYLDKWDWVSLSFNKGIPWSIELVEKYFDKWSWTGLCTNPSFPWSVSLIEKYMNWVDWGRFAGSSLGLSKNEGLNWSLQLLRRYKDKWGEQGLSKNEGITWTVEMINEVRSWGYEIDPFSNKNSPWSIDYILSNKDVIKFYEIFSY